MSAGHTQYACLFILTLFTALNHAQVLTWHWLAAGPRPTDTMSLAAFALALILALAAVGAWRRRHQPDTRISRVLKYLLVFFTAIWLLQYFGYNFMLPWKQRETDDFGPADITHITARIGVPFPASTQYLNLRMAHAPDGADNELKVSMAQADADSFISAGIFAHAERIESSGLGHASGNWWNAYQYDFVQYRVEFPRPASRPVHHGAPRLTAFVTQPPGDTCVLYIEYLE